MKKSNIFFFCNILLISILSFTSCEDEKDDEEKHANMIVSHTYNDRTLLVSIENKNNENVTVEITARYNLLNSQLGSQYVQDKIKMKPNEKVEKEYKLNGDTPYGLEFTYRVY